MEFSAGTFVTILAVIGLLALIVSVITEVTKGVALLSKIPVNLQVIVLSLTLTIITYIAYTSYSGDAIIWYYIVATIIVGFIVSYVVLFGWDKFADLYKRFRNIPPIDIAADTSSVTASDKAVTYIDTKIDLMKDTSVIDSSVTTKISTSDTLTTTKVTEIN
jgi:hypothetical protein